MIKFKIKLSLGGSAYDAVGNHNELFDTVYKRFISQQNFAILKVNTILCNAKKIDMNKTLSENNITNESTVVLIFDTENYKNRLSRSNSHYLFNIYSTNLINKINDTNNSTLNISKYISSKNINNLSSNNQSLQKGKDFLINICKIPNERLDPIGDCFDKWQINRKNGPPGYLKDYSPPLGWTGIGLKVLNLYDNGDNTWLGTINKNGQWYIAYHGIKTLASISGILNIGFRRGPFQLYKNKKNDNPLNNQLYPICGEGVYFIPNFTDATRNTNIIYYLGYKIRVVLMCRINPYKVRIAKIGYNQESWIVNGDKLNDINGRIRDDEVRPYRILINFEN